MRRTALMFASALGALLGSGALTAASAPASPPRSWAAIAHWPDFEGGIWSLVRGPGMVRTSARFVPAIAARLAAMGPIRPETLGNAYCIPTEGPFERVGEFFYSKDAIFILQDEDFLTVRHIYMDGGAHDDLDPSYMGRSLGHWEGDTLVIVTDDFLPEVTIAPYVRGEGATTAVERIRITAPGQLEQQVTITNPKVLLEPWTSTYRYKYRPDLHAQEAFCSQNNRDLPDANGNAHVNLTPPK